MEPETSIPKLGSEQAPEKYGPNVEHVPQQSVPERGIETVQERHEQVSENAAIAADSGMPSILPAPVIVDENTTRSSSVTVDGPAIAADEDLIEKEWVERAKKVIADTQNDPHGREQAVNQLQKDYRTKRYGGELDEA